MSAKMYLSEVLCHQGCYRISSESECSMFGKYVSIVFFTLKNKIGRDLRLVWLLKILLEKALIWKIVELVKLIPSVEACFIRTFEEIWCYCQFFRGAIYSIFKLYSQIP